MPHFCRINEERKKNTLILVNASVIRHTDYCWKVEAANNDEGYEKGWNDKETGLEGEPFLSSFGTFYTFCF